jgi:hypothetical protein
VEVGIKEGQKENEVAPPLEENNEVHEDGPAVSVSKYHMVLVEK